jgi:hypothetical protein
MPAWARICVAATNGGPSVSRTKTTEKLRIESANKENAAFYALYAAAYWVGAVLLLGGIAHFNRGPLSFDISSRDFNPIVLMPVIVAIGGVFYLARAGRDWLRARWFGTSVLEIDEVVAGHRMQGTLRTARNLDSRSGFVLRLQCIQSQEIAVAGQTSGFTHKTIVDHVLCELFQKVDGQTMRSNAGIPVDFALPGDMPATHGIQGVKGSIRWALIAEARLAGLNYNAVFRIPVRSKSTR